MNQFELLKYQELLRARNIVNSFNTASNTDRDIAASLGYKEDNIEKGFNPNQDLYTDILKADQTPAQQAKIKKVMEEFKAGTLKSSAGTKITDRKQAIAIAMSEAGIVQKGDYAQTQLPRNDLNLM